MQQLYARLSGRAPDTVTFLVLYAMLAVVDVASRALAGLLARVDTARLRFLLIVNGPGLRVSPLACAMVMLGLALVAAWLLASDHAGSQLALAPALVALDARRTALLTEGDALVAKGDARTVEESARLLALTADGGDLDKVSAELKAVQRLHAEERALIVRPGARVEAGRDLAGDAPWGNFGTYLQAVHRAHTGGNMDPRLGAVATGMGESVGADGGFAIPMEYAEGIEKSMYETGELLSRVNDLPIGGNSISFNMIDETSRANGSRRGAVLGYWVDEGTAPDPSRIKLAKVEMKLRKVAALGYVTDELMEDAPALSGELTQAFTEELQFMTEDSIVEGTGAGQPQGYLQAACLISVAKEAGQAAATVVFENLIKMWARLPARSKANAVWLINVDTEPQLDQMALPVGTGGLEPRFVTYGPEGTLRIKGRPVIPVEYCATLGTVGDIALVDLAQYRLIRKAAGVQSASSMHVRFTQGEQTFKATYRVDGQAKWRSAVTPFKGTNTLSPFVVLATRA